MSSYLLTIINTLGVAQALFVAIALLLLPNRNKAANRILAALMGVFALMFGYDILFHNDLVVPPLVFARLPLIYLYAPLCWLYLKRTSTANSDQAASRPFRHFVVCAVALIAYAPALLLSWQDQVEVIRYGEYLRRSVQPPELDAIQTWLLAITPYRMPVFVLQTCVYWVLFIRLLARHRQRVKDHYSYTDKVSLDWVRYLMLMVIAMWLQVPLREFVLGGTAAAGWLSDLLVLEQVIFVFLIGLFGLLQVNLFEGRSPTPVAPALVQDAPTPKYQSSTLQEIQIEEGLQQLLLEMATEKPYLNSELTITDLASRLDIPARHLSQIINSRQGKNFLDFVNGYRIDAAKSYLRDAACSKSILEIALEVGFNSKSAFYTAFKRHAAVTPTHFRQLHATAPAAVQNGLPDN